jgi:hypothetical protein
LKDRILSVVNRSLLCASWIHWQPDWYFLFFGLIKLVGS